MAYIPGSMQSSVGEKKGGYIPSSEQNSKPVESFIAPDLQLLIDEAAKKLEQDKESVAKSSSEESSESSMSLEERFAYLRSERNKRLARTDFVNDSGRPTSFEERGKLYKYRQELRDLPSLEGAPWTPKTIPWPTSPLTGEGSH